MKDVSVFSYGSDFKTRRFRSLIVWQFVLSVNDTSVILKRVNDERYKNARVNEGF